MKKINSVSLVGLGAIGAAYGTRLHDSLAGSFQVIANDERMKRYEETPFQIGGNEYRFNYITPETKVEPADLVIIAVKNAELPQAIEDMRNHVGPDTIILSLLNGITSEKEISKVYQNAHILYSMCVSIDAVRESNQITFSSLGKICFGEKDNRLSDDVLAVKELFERADIAYEIPEDIWLSMWWKFMLNVGANQVSAILQAPYRVFQEVPAASQLLYSAMSEVAAISEKVGVNLGQEDIKKAIDTVKALSPEGKTSMLQDVEAGRKTEVEYFGKEVCELGREYAIPTPVNEQLYLMLHVIEEKAKLEKFV